MDTPRLRFSRVSRGDVDTLHRIWTDPGVRRYLWDDVTIDRETAAQVVEQTVRDWAEHHYGLWLVRERDGTEAIGFVGFRSSGDPAVPELLFGFLPAWWHRGLATEAARAALQYLFEVAGADSAWAETDPPNTASVRVLERVGMQFDGVYRITRPQ